MKKKITSLLIISLVMGLSMQLDAQNRQGRGFVQAQNQSDYGYCLTGIDLTADQQAKISQMQKAHQEAMTPLRNKLQGTRDWDVKNQMRAQMNALKAKHQEEIWTLIPASRGKSLNLKQGTGRGQGFAGQGRGRSNNLGFGRGAGRGGAGRGVGRGAGRAAGQGVGRGINR
ncbi:MAG: hypothetical protein HN352_09630 [Bacteroidetes bacterium]|jgi:hypothetical protein|nr:hypothetical protein [Bacteroidota bacterium]MBT3748705.1 hypothetical protein [Bacteroidota bacterium]MBT4410504.1 hypothetical protein [Bacteroidota bacterium]MBT5426575.1 hypothetical protein [Bacteroidota bacterium]MBT7094442.1 hypothetical protein [Bacteroidota bacterium]